MDIFGMSMGVIWLIVLAVMIIIELATMGLTTVWFAGGALVAAIAAVFDVGIPLQIILFIAVSVLLMIAMRPITLKYLNNNRTKTNVQSFIGQVARVTKRIDNLNQEGEVMLNGIEWMARTVDEQSIEEGELVTVKEVSGVKLIVEKR